jgi:hypothetical protein
MYSQDQQVEEASSHDGQHGSVPDGLDVKNDKPDCESGLRQSCYMALRGYRSRVRGLAGGVRLRPD